MRFRKRNASGWLFGVVHERLKFRQLVTIMAWLLATSFSIPVATATGSAPVDNIAKGSYVANFPLDKGDELIDFKLEVEERGFYMFEIAFVDPYHYSDKRSDAIIKVVGRGGYRDGKYLDDGRPLRMHFRLDALSGGGNLHIDESIDEFPRSGLSGGKWLGKTGYLRNRLIKGLVLDPGIYRITMQNLDAAPDVAWIETLLSVHRRIAK